MKIFKKIVIGYVFYTFPLTFILFLYVLFKNPNFESAMDSMLGPPVAVQGLIWSLTSLALTISMFFSQALRNSVLAKLSGIKERDEREAQIVGKALKSSYLTSMTILLLLLSVSFVRIEIGRVSNDILEPGELRGYIQFGFGV